MSSIKSYGDRDPLTGDRLPKDSRSFGHGHRDSSSRGSRKDYHNRHVDDEHASRGGNSISCSHYNSTSTRNYKALHHHHRSRSTWSRIRSCGNRNRSPTPPIRKRQRDWDNRCHHRSGSRGKHYNINPKPAKKRRQSHHEDEENDFWSLESAKCNKSSGNSNTGTSTAPLEPEGLSSPVEKWIRSAPDEVHYNYEANGVTRATTRTRLLCEKFEATLLTDAKAAREEAERLGEMKMKELVHIENTKGCCNEQGTDDTHSESDSSSANESSDDDDKVETTTWRNSAQKEMERRQKHPRRLHPELWHNEPALLNVGPACRCSPSAKRVGIRHGIYPGEEGASRCDPFSNNKSHLFHYRLTVSPPTNLVVESPSVIRHDEHEYIFEGFSVFSHYKLDLSLPPCKLLRFNTRYQVWLEEERFPDSFCVQELALFQNYLFREILELLDFVNECGGGAATGEGEEEGGDGGECSQFHFMPRFVRQLPDNGLELLSMSRVLSHLRKSYSELVKEEDLYKLYTMKQTKWQNFADPHKGSIVVKWGMKPCALRIDQIDRDLSDQRELGGEENGIPFPFLVHFGLRPPQMSYVGNAEYQKEWARFVKYNHLLSNMPKPTRADKAKLRDMKIKLRGMRTSSKMQRGVTVAISSTGFRNTGLSCDIVQHALLIPVLVSHLRFHKCLQTLEARMEYRFKNRQLLQLAVTHASFKDNFGTNADHARNALSNCGIRQAEYGDKRIHSNRKRGIDTLINIMSKFGAEEETLSDVANNERLEFLGDAVVEFVTTIHLFHLFPDLEEGGLATYRGAIVQNQHLAELAKTLKLDEYMLYAHGSDLCHEAELRHALANCFEALMAALFLDGGIEVADRVFGNTLFGTEPVLLDIWRNYPKHPLQRDEPTGDRHWIEANTVLQKLTEFESSIGIRFNHIRLLAKAFTDRSLGYNTLTRGSNQRLELFGDTVLQLITSDYLYRHFPDHHEGHLSLLRSSLVNNRTQSAICEELGMSGYAMRAEPKAEMKTKWKADLLEAFLGALYLDKGLPYCQSFCKICFLSRLNESITEQQWNDPKSKLQQCCLTVRSLKSGKEPDIPVYKVIESNGPTHSRTYSVAVYFRGNRLGTGRGQSIQEAEMNAATLALQTSANIFPQLQHQKVLMDGIGMKQGCSRNKE